MDTHKEHIRKSAEIRKCSERQAAMYYGQYLCSVLGLRDRYWTNYFANVANLG